MNCIVSINSRPRRKVELRVVEAETLADFCRRHGVVAPFHGSRILGRESVGQAPRLRNDAAITATE
jgi:hypothetical protein